jgi:hypothetical protein
MAQPPAPLTLRKEDHAEAPGWIARLFEQLNTFFASSTAALARGLTRAENFRSVTKTVTFTTRPTAAETFPITVKHDLGQRPSDVWVGRLRGAVAGPWSFTWEIDTGGNLSVRFQGLDDSTRYEARLIIE